MDDQRPLNLKVKARCCQATPQTIIIIISNSQEETQENFKRGNENTNKKQKNTGVRKNLKKRTGVFTAQTLLGTQISLLFSSARLYSLSPLARANQHEVERIGEVSTK
ncbi:hypothetical protein, unlikely [Trypanosoma brucei gambiense DAL972]|uniref:Uncharacterized protein n=1 Tax=Trypanosoma brucei gambiense (strain MHOM/CI/86/DAL972) TaxID=679716 RepID=D0A682_TRYB9|nr:hypothetical protein, unlikely [Trypanosoma brucei gambiense DAL972]CBH17183.1 hypothetical protein, unlikely [Trypanosoma brucei gambiense DAL972]|eukprot:XP_011779447.1 hypothetical protein, unlikely [Trypanosoma brucei gambiense DAL972]